MTTQSKKIPAIVATIADTKLELTFANGNTLRLDANTLPRELQTQAMMHGLKQKLCDAAAKGCDTDTGKSATIDEKYAAVCEVYERLTQQHLWNKTREGGGGNSILLQALFRMYKGKKSMEVLRDYLRDKTKAEQVALSRNPKLAKIIEEVQAERAGAFDGDVEELFGELDAL